jgi:hypothetical protein
MSLQDKQTFVKSILPTIKGMSQRTPDEKLIANTIDKQSHTKLRELSRLPTNKDCADCQSKVTGWASLPHGVFICINCAQIHRHIGVHISQVKAFNTGTYIWYPDEIACMELMGNLRANELYFNKFIDKPTADADFYQREKYIRDKYEYLKWVNMFTKKIEKPKIENLKFEKQQIEKDLIDMW